VLLAPPYSTLILGVPVAPDRQLGLARAEALIKLFGREIIFEVGPISTYVAIVITVSERYGQTDRQTQTTYCRIIALCEVSRGKNDC